ncbi:Ribonuclease P protein subunit p30 [Cichlidogyrus casuarinus]|uniref:Ribonuclease P protein subunit p30 n=1 Tax=Cichlidogyrus casuarinus TaxID=1844966 RepID=A0ABD2Q8H6_9PLAT
MLSSFLDLDVPNDTLTPELLANLLDSGYNWFGVGKTVDIDEFTFTNANNSKKSKKDRHDMKSSFIASLEPINRDFKQLIEDAVTLRLFPNPLNDPETKPVRIFTRLNLKFSSTDNIGLFYREFEKTLTEFDILCLIPSTTKTLSYCLDSAPCLDLISLEDMNPIDIFVSPKDFNTLSKKGLHFEVKTGKLFRSPSEASSARSYLASMFTQLSSRCRSALTKHIIVSSGAIEPWEIKRPVGLVSLLSTLGLEPLSKIKDCFSSNPHATIYHGLSRRHSVHGAAILLKQLENKEILSAEIVPQEPASSTKRKSDSPLNESEKKKIKTTE